VLDPAGRSSRTVGRQSRRNVRRGKYSTSRMNPVSIGVDRQFGGTGAGRIQPRGVRQCGRDDASIYFRGRGVGDLDIGYLRHLAIGRNLGYLSATKVPDLM